MRRPPRQIFLPAVAFLVLLALAVGTVVHAGQTPRGALYGRLLAYVESVETGDAEVAVALAPDLERLALVDHVEALQGLVGHVQHLALSEDGLGGEAQVAWLDPRGRARRIEVLDWARPALGPWRLARIEILR